MLSVSTIARLVTVPLLFGCVGAAAQTLVALSLSPTQATLATGDAQQFVAMGSYSDGSTRNLTGSVEWNSSASSVLAVSTAGVATGLAPGTATLQASSGSVSSSASISVVSSALVGWWRFSEGAGTIASDATGDGNATTLDNGITWVAGQSGGAIAANGINQYGTVPAINLSGTQAITWTAWINRMWTSGADALLENSANFNASTTGFGFFPDDWSDCGASNTLMTGVRGNVGYTLNCYAQPTSNTWHHLAIVCDKSRSGPQAISFYLDGQLQKPVTQPYTATNTNAFGSNLTYLFARGGVTQFSAAQMADLRLYTQALSAAQIQKIYRQGLGNLVALTLSPASAAFSTGSTQQFTATGTYASGVTQDLTASVTWSSSNPNVATISAAGLVTGIAVGSTAVQASLGGVGAAASVAVVSPVLQSLAVSPSGFVLTAGSTTQYTATGSYDNGTTKDMTAAVLWSSSNPAVAAISASGAVTAKAAGSTLIQAASGSLSASALLSVVAAGASLQSISITPAAFALVPGATQQLTATGTYSDLSQEDVTDVASWSSANTQVATVSAAGQVNALMVGSVGIQAALSGITGSAQASITAPAGMVGWWRFDEGAGTLASDSSGNGDSATLYNAISWISGELGDAITANGINQYAEIPALNLTTTRAVTWTAWVNRTWSDGAQVLLENSANFNNSTTGFGFFPDDSGDCRVAGTMMAALHGDVGYAVNCYAQPSSNQWHHLAVVYDKSQTGSNAISLYLDGTLQKPVAQPYTATNTNSFDTNATYLFARGGIGQFAAGSIDDLRIYNQALSATQIQQIYQQGLGSLLSISVLPANLTLSTAKSQPYTATGTYSSGSSKDLTNSVAWSSSNPAVASVDASGLVTTLALGTTALQASLNGVSGSTALSVIAGASLVSLAITPASASIVAGATQQLTATGTYSDGTSKDLTSTVSWSSAATSIATVSASGLVSAVAAGTTSVQAMLAGINATAQISVMSSSGLAGWWKFDEGTGNAAADASGYSNTATLVNGVSWVPGQIGDAVAANGANQYVSVPPINLSGTPAVSWSAWINRVYGAGTGALIENSSNFNSSTTGFGFFPDDAIDCGAAGTMMTGVHGNNGYTLNCYAQPSSGVWHHFAAVYNKGLAGASVVSLYIDGVLQKPVSQPYTVTNSNSFGSNPSYLFSRGGGSNFSAGSIDDLRLYSQALSATQVQQLYAQGLGTLTSLTLAPANATLSQGASQQYTATGTYSSGMTRDLSASVTWKSSDTNVATIGSSGLVTAAGVGTVTLQASYAGVVSTTGLTVTSATSALQSITLTPANLSLAVAASLQFTATGIYADGSSKDLTPVVTWTSSSPSVASVSSSGVVTGLLAGATTIRAAYSSVVGQSGLTVTAPVGHFVQWSSGDAGATTSETTYQANNAASGNLILVFAHWDNQAVSATVKDQVGNNYVAIFPQTNTGPSDSFQVWYAQNIRGGIPLAVTLTFTGRTNTISVVDVIEYAGLSTSAALDVFTSAIGNGTTQSSGYMPVTTTANETIIGLFGYSGYATPYAAGPGYTFRDYDASTVLEDRTVASTGIYSATATSSSTAYWAAFCIGFRNQQPAPPTLVFSPATVTAGGTAVATVQLANPAPPGGASVSLVSSQPLVAPVPASITIAAGATTASFSVTTSAVASATTVTVYATYGATRSATLSVAPATIAQVTTNPAPCGNKSSHLGGRAEHLDGCALDASRSPHGPDRERANPASATLRPAM